MDFIFDFFSPFKVIFSAIQVEIASKYDLADSIEKLKKISTYNVDILKGKVTNYEVILQINHFIQNNLDPTFYGHFEKIDNKIFLKGEITISMLKKLMVYFIIAFGLLLSIPNLYVSILTFISNLNFFYLIRSFGFSILVILFLFLWICHYFQNKNKFYEERSQLLNEIKKALEN